jgi:hypothetical protein
VYHRIGTKANVGFVELRSKTTPVAWNNLGTLFILRGDPENRKEYYRKVVELGFTPTTGLAKD